MTDIPIECPHCHESFKLNETLAAPLVEETRKQMMKDIESRRKTLEDREKELAKSRQDILQQQAQVTKLKQEVDEQVAKKLAEQRQLIATEESRKAKRAFEEQLEQRQQEQIDLKNQLEEQRKKLDESRKAELEFRRMQRELADKEASLQIELEKQLMDRLGPERAKARKESEEQYKLVLAEREKMIEDQKKQLAEAQRKLAQGSQQLQGEVQELELEKLLRESFPHDNISPVPKGQFGGDTVQIVLSPQGQKLGAVLWESKRTKTWSKGWIDKLKQDQRTAKAELAIIVTQAMPDGVDHFSEVDGIWVTTPALAIPLASVLRESLAELFSARRATENQEDKMQRLYTYLTGTEFRQRVEALTDAFMSMSKDLDDEIRLFNKHWAKRRKQIERIMHSTTGMYGDLQGIAGTSSIPEIDALKFAELPEPAESPQKED